MVLNDFDYPFILSITLSFLHSFISLLYSGFPYFAFFILLNGFLFLPFFLPSFEYSSKTRVENKVGNIMKQTKKLHHSWCIQMGSNDFDCRSFILFTLFYLFFFTVLFYSYILVLHILLFSPSVSFNKRGTNGIKMHHFKRVMAAFFFECRISNRTAVFSTNSVSLSKLSHFLLVTLSLPRFSYP